MDDLEKGKKLLATIALLGPLLCFQACTVGPDFREPELENILQGGWDAGGGTDGQFARERQPETEWWQQFHDEALAGLVTQLYASSLPLAQARERIIEINARQGVVGADRRLQLAAALGYTRAETGDEAVSLQGIPAGKTLDVFSAGLVAGWELDLWGRVARMLEAGEQDIRSSYAEYQGLMVSMAAELSLSYIEARTLQARLTKVRENIALQEKTLALAQSRFDAGNGSALEVARTQRLVSGTRARIPELERSLAVAGNRINVLLGLPPKSASSFLVPCRRYPG